MNPIIARQNMVAFTVNKPGSPNAKVCSDVSFSIFGSVAFQGAAQASCAFTGPGIVRGEGGVPIWTATVYVPGQVNVFIQYYDANGVIKQIKPVGAIGGWTDSLQAYETVPTGNTVTFECSATSGCLSQSNYTNTEDVSDGIGSVSWNGSAQ